MALSALTGTLKAFVSFSTTLAAAGRQSMRGTDEVQSASLEKTASISLGTGALQANQLFADSRAIAGSAAVDLLNVSGGNTGTAIKNPHDQTITATKIVAIAIVNTSLSYALKVFGHATLDVASIVGASGDKITIRPGGMLLIGPATGSTDTVGYAVSTNEVLQLCGDGTNIATYDIVMFLVGTAA
jgi:hypothetical protein